MRGDEERIAKIDQRCLLPKAHDDDEVEVEDEDVVVVVVLRCLPPRAQDDGEGRLG